MKIIAQTFVTLDGVMQGPGGIDEDTDGGFDLGGWQAPLADPETGEVIVARYRSASALLLGRRTYDIWAPYWPSAPEGSEPFRSMINDMPKYVASRTRSEFAWSNCHSIGPDATAGVRELKQQASGDLLVPGSSDLLQTLLDQDLVDELEMIVYPIVLGKGRRLFESGLSPSRWQLIESAAKPGGAVVCVYRFGGRPEFGEI